MQSNGEIHFLDALPAGEHHDHPADFHRSRGNEPGAEPAQSRACDVPSCGPGDWRGSRVGMVSALDRVRVGGVRDAADSRLTHHPASMAGSTGATLCFCRSVQRIQCGRSGQVSSDRASGKQPGVVAGQPKRLDADLPRVDAGLHHHHLAGDDHSDCCGKYVQRSGYVGSNRVGGIVAGIFVVPDRPDPPHGCFPLRCQVVRCAGANPRDAAG